MIRAADQIKPSGTPTPVTQRMTRDVLAPADGVPASNLQTGNAFIGNYGSALGVNLVETFRTPVNAAHQVYSLQFAYCLGLLRMGEPLGLKRNRIFSQIIRASYWPISCHPQR
jgi:hypothetical protein